MFYPDFFDLVIIGFCLASSDRVVGLSYFPYDGGEDYPEPVVIYYYYDDNSDKFYFAVCVGCEDTPETRKNAVFVPDPTLNSLYHNIPFAYRDKLNGKDHCAFIRSKSEFNINISSI